MARVAGVVKLRRDAARAEGERPVRSAIVTADDFGLSRAVNAGVIRSHRDGVLTATSLMVTGAARDEAAALARDHPALDVGLHLVVCRGRAVRIEQLHGVVDDSGEFARNPTLAGMRYFFNPRVRSLLRDELRAQIDLQLELIGGIGHLDGHLNFHVHPSIATMLGELVAEYGIRAVRIPREPVFTTLSLARDHTCRKLVEAFIFRSLSRRARRIFNEAGAQSSDWLFGLHQSGNLSETYVARIIERLRPGVTELYFHPSDDLSDDALSFTPGRREVAILTSSRMREALQAARIELTNFATLHTASRHA